MALTAHDDDSYLRQLCKAGASGYVLKRSAGEELIKALESWPAAKFTIERSLASKALARQSAGTAAPAAAERPQLVRAGKGSVASSGMGLQQQGNRRQLGLSVKTVETYKIRVGEKLGLRSRAQLVQYALRQGWLSDEQAPQRLGR